MQQQTKEYQETYKDIAFSKAYPETHVTAMFKTEPADFIVEENMRIDFSMEGEHCWLYIQKQGCNTDWVAQQLARYCEVRPVAVSYAGLKDRQAVTMQWFSVHLPGRADPDWQDIEKMINDMSSMPKDISSVRILKHYRHHRKLKRGALQSNTFRVKLRELNDTSDETYDLLSSRCLQIADRGVPNYFGEQRFGRHRNNLAQAEKLFSSRRNRISRHKRSLYLSAARSWIFNHILSQRIDLGVWDTSMPGDVFMLNGRSACFSDEGEDADVLQARLQAGEIHPTAVMWGEGDTMVHAQAKQLESQVIDDFPEYRDGLVKARVQASRRACRVIPENLEYKRVGDDVELAFTLPSGSYATAVLAEIFSELQTGV